MISLGRAARPFPVEQLGIGQGLAVSVTGIGAPCVKTVRAAETAERLAVLV